MDKSQIDAQNIAALLKREKMRRSNPRPSLKISELTQMPPYNGFVDAHLFDDLSFVMFLCNNDDGVALRLLWNGYFEPMSLGLWTLLAKQASVVFDIGAHTGIYSLVAGLANRQATVVSCEPHDMNFARLLVNLRTNGLPSGTAYPIAISDSDQTVPFSVSTGLWYLSTGGAVGARDQAITRPVQAVRLDTAYLRNRKKISLVKIDTEGHEGAVIEGANTVISECSPDFIMESVFNEETGGIEAIFRSHGYSFYLIDDEKHEIYPVESLAPVGTLERPDMGRLNRLITRRDRNDILDLAAKVKGLLCIPAVI